MDQYSEEDVRRELEPYHGRILKVVHRGHFDWVKLKRFMANSNLGQMLFPRTVANIVFDFVAQHALAEFQDDETVRVVREPQTVKFCIGDVLVARFKKGDEDNLGRNVATQAVMEFVLVQGSLPGLPPAAAKVEFLYSETEIADSIDRVIVAARDGDELLWSYELNDAGEAGDIIPFPDLVGPDEGGEDADEGLVVPRVSKDESSESED